MQVRVSCLDFTTQAPVTETNVTCHVSVAPRFETLDDAPDLDGSDRPPTLLLAGQPGGPGDDEEPHRRIVLAADRAVALRAQTATTGPSGLLVFAVDLAAAYARMIEAHAHAPSFYDVAALVAIEGSAEGLRRRSAAVFSTTSSDAPDGDIELRRLVLMDFAKTVVGHTTERDCRLWFQLHGPQLPGRDYVCAIARVDAPTTVIIRPVRFEPEGAMTGIVQLHGLDPGASYGYRLLTRPIRPTPVSPRPRVLCSGSFSTAAAGEDRLSILFGSCHKPLDNGIYDPASDLRIWRRLADRPDGDVLLLTGDQIYGDEIPEPRGGSSWFDSYVARYNAFWAYQPVRQAISRRPTYMTPDDHDVTDDWGADPDIDRDRIGGAKQAIRTFQLAHSPSGVAGDVHYHFRRGPAAFYLMDGRTARGKDPNFPIFGARQFDDLRAWAVSPEAQTADIIVFVASVPVALIPVEQIRDLAEDTVTWGGVLAGAGAGYLIGGPAGGVLGGIVGAAGASIAYDQVEKEQLKEFDAPDMWAYEPNQTELVRLLDLLFGLATDTHPNGTDNGHPRAVFVLSGDAHFGLAHMIASNHTGQSRLDHRRNPQLMQLLSSAIGRKPQSSEKMRMLFEDLDEDAPDFDSITGSLIELIDGSVTEFVLDDKRDGHYRARALAALFERNVGKLQFERVGPGRRYHFHATIEGETRSLVQLFEVDLDARPVSWRSLIGDVLTATGRPVLLRVNEVGAGFGPREDRLDAEVLVQLDSEPHRTYGFRLRPGVDGDVHEGMLIVLRAAFNRRGRVRLEYRRTGVRNGELIRVSALD